MLAGFIGLRLVSVLGKRTGDEKAVVPGRSGSATGVVAASNRAEPVARRIVAVPAGTAADVAPSLQAIADVDPGFDPAKFLAGSRAAYRLILDAFWAGDARRWRGWCPTRCSNISASPSPTATPALPHSLTSIDAAAITAARMVGQMAEVTVRFEATIVTGGVAAAGHDVWTFSRHIGTADPAWLLIETDADA